ncbi:hypothetical protein DIS24_g8931 [Lasiodiplodia hormozganensis]|uniref:Uncharacterized protein n=1 Tax=Lasiodiplodia hormozganensis TaxID=869390 RepID=A0AA39XYB1_9PEZI|nr:hypothetical protein DIS24_g8931 [Lasiodiplodia hormozganensis]
MQSDDLFKEFESQHSAAELGFDAFIAVVHAHLPDPDTYYRFCRARSRASLEEIYMAIPPDDFLHSSVPIVPLGHDAKGVKYRLATDFFGLDPPSVDQLDDEVIEPRLGPGLQLLPTTLLGATMTETNDGFCFCQLDELHCSDANSHIHFVPLPFWLLLLVVLSP